MGSAQYDMRRFFGDPPRSGQRDEFERVMAGLLEQLFSGPPSNPELEEKRRKAFDALATEFERRVIARAIVQGLTPADYVRAVRRLPRIGPNVLNDIPLSALADAALVLDCRVEITLRPNDGSQPAPESKDLITRLQKLNSKRQGLGDIPISIFFRPCDDPTCSCNKNSGSVVSENAADKARGRVVDETVMDETIEEIKAALDGSLAPDAPGEGWSQDDTGDLGYGTDADRAVSFAGADAHLEQAYEERTEVED